MDKHKIALLSVASVTVAFCGAAVKVTYDQLGDERPAVDTELVKTVVKGAAVISVLAVLTAVL